MRKSHHWVGFAVSALALMVGGCTTIQDLRGPSFVPESYGVEALKAKIAEERVTPVDGEAAARALGNRTLSREDGVDMLSLLALNRHPRINVALLETIQKKDMDYLLSGLKKLEGDVKDSDTAVTMYETIASFLPEGDMREYAEERLRESSYATVRYLAVAELVGGTHETPESVFIDALQKETNAVVALELCHALFTAGSSNALPVLSEVANDVERVYRPDTIRGSRADANSVRIAAIQAFEAITEIYSE